MSIPILAEDKDLYCSDCDELMLEDKEVHRERQRHKKFISLNKQYELMTDNEKYLIDMLQEFYCPKFYPVPKTYLIYHSYLIRTGVYGSFNYNYLREKALLKRFNWTYLYRKCKTMAEFFVPNYAFFYFCRETAQQLTVAAGLRGKNEQSRGFDHAQ